MTNRRGRCKHQRGASLVEVLIAFVLIGVCALGLVKLQATLEAKADFAKHSIEALYLAENQLEKFTQRGISSATAVYSYSDIALDACVTDSPCSSSVVSGYEVDCRVTPFAALSDAVSTVAVEVCWLDRRGTKRTIELVTMISQYSEFD